MFKKKKKANLEITCFLLYNPSLPHPTYQGINLTLARETLSQVK